MEKIKTRSGAVFFYILIIIVVQLAFMPKQRTIFISLDSLRNFADGSPDVSGVPDSR